MDVYEPWPFQGNAFFCKQSFCLVVCLVGLFVALLLLVFVGIFVVFILFVLVFVLFGWFFVAVF